MTSTRRASLLSFFALVAVACAAAPAPPPPATAVVAAPPPAPVAAVPVDVSPPEDDLPLPILATDPTWGSRHAYVTLVEFGELQCPFCARVRVTVKALEDKYGPDVLRVVWKHEPQPFHENARAAAEAAQGVFALGGSEKFWAFTDAAFAEQARLGPEAYEGWAQGVGVDPARLHQGLASGEWAPVVDASHALAKKLDVVGTPNFFVNGAHIAGSQPEKTFTDAIDAELAKARAREQAGTVRDRLYAVLSAEAIAAHRAVAPKKEPKVEDTTTVYKVPLGGGPIRGGAQALVTIVELGDYQCPFTKRVEETLESIRTAYGDKVRFVWGDLPLASHTRAEPAAELAREARAQKGDAAFWKVHDALFASQPKLEDDDLERIAKDAGLDARKAMAAVAAHKHKVEIERDQSRADDLQAGSTPHFFINGRRLTGAQPFEKFQPIIEEEIVRASGLLAKGTKPAALYDALVKDGKPPPEPATKTVAIPAKAASRGSPTAPVVIQEFSDFQCPFCQRVQDPLAQVAREYPTKVRFVWRDLPLPMHKQATLAAEAAREAMAQRGPDGFWKMHDRLFAEQKTPGGLERASLDRYAAEMGLDMTAWAAALDGHVHARAIEDDRKAASEAEITGTPGFVIGNYFLSGSQPYSKFRKLIERALRDGAKGGAQAAVRAHTP